METTENRGQLENVDYVEKRLGEPRWRIYELARAGLIPAVRIGRRYKFDPSAVEAWISNGGSSLADVA